MAAKKVAFLSLSIFTILLISFSSPGQASSSCNGPCQTLNDCDGQLICIKGKCNDDPDVGTNTCGSSGGGGSPSTPTSGTPAKLTLNDFSEGGDGGGPSECDEKYHENSERVVALSTRWYAGGSKCGKMIRIVANNGKSVTAKVVDECDSSNGCASNVVDASIAVWRALGLNTDLGRVPITWSMA